MLDILSYFKTLILSLGYLWLNIPVVKQPRSSLELVSFAAVEKETSLERVLWPEDEGVNENWLENELLSSAGKQSPFQAKTNLFKGRRKMVKRR